MKKLICNTMLLFCLGVVGYFPALANGGTMDNNPVVADLLKKEFTKNIKKEFDISPNGTVDLLNKYGKVDVKTWANDRVKIEVQIIVNSNSEENANTTFDRINVAFSESNNLVSAETTIETQKKSSWGSSWWGGSSNSSDFTINYEVYMPATCDLELDNKYGHTTVEKISGKAKITAKYGDVRMDGVDNNLKLDIGYGNATIESAQDADVYIKYGKLRMEAVRDLNLESKYSKVYISSAGDLETISKYDTYRLGDIRDISNSGKYDDFEIKSANSVNAVSKYSDFDIQYLKSKGKFNLEYGGLNIEKLSRDFSKLEVDSRYTGIEVEVEENAQYEIDVVTNYAGIHYPDRTEVRYEADESNTHEVRGFVGNKTSKNLVHIRASYGGVKVR